MLAGLLLLAAATSSTSSEKKKVIIDADPAALVHSGLSGTDDLAIVLALGSTSLHILGITVTYGNGPLKHTSQDLTRLLSVAKTKYVPVFNGSDWDTRHQLAITPAVKFMRDTLLAHPSESITVVCLGPLTTLAALITHFPDAAGRISVAVLSGSLGSEFELNFYAHMEATKIVLDSTVPKAVINLALCMQAPLDIAFFDQIHQSCCEPGSTAVGAVCELLPALKSRARMAPWMENVLWQQLLVRSGLKTNLHELPTNTSSQGVYACDVLAIAFLESPRSFGHFVEDHMEVTEYGLRQWRLKNEELGGHGVKQLGIFPLSVGDPDKLRGGLVKNVCALRHSHPPRPTVQGDSPSPFGHLEFHGYYLRLGSLWLLAKHWVWLAPYFFFLLFTLLLLLVVPLLLPVLDYSGCLRLLLGPSKQTAPLNKSPNHTKNKSKEPKPSKPLPPKQRKDPAAIKREISKKNRVTPTGTRTRREG